MTLAPGSILLEGLLLSLGLSVIILGSLRYNPRLWLQDYPPEIQARVAPLTAQEKRQRIVVGAAFLAVTMGVMYGSTMRLHRDNGGNPSFWAIFLNTYGVLQVFNVFDAVVLDYILLTVIRPAFAMLPGSEGVDEASLHLFRFHVVNFLKGCVYLAVISAIVAALVSLV